jgi:hypothetical protein
MQVSSNWAAIELKVSHQLNPRFQPEQHILVSMHQMHPKTPRLTCISVFEAAT